MSEKRFLNCLFIEGMILMLLGLSILVIPKLTMLTFGVVLSSAFIFYGIYKIIHSFINKNFAKNFVFEIFLGIFITILGILLLFVPKISLLWLITLIGIYFLLESILTTAFLSQIRNVFNFWGIKFLSSTVLFLVGFIIVLGIPVISFWVVAILSGIAFLTKGISKITLFLINKYNYNI